MSVRKSSSGRRTISSLAFWLVSLVLVIGILYFAYGAALQGLRYTNEQGVAEERAPLYAQTATALAGITAESTPEATDADASNEASKRARRPSEWEQAFATNTPQPGSLVATPDAAVPPTPDANQPTRPLPTAFFYQAPAEAEAAGTAVPTPVEPLNRQNYDLMNILLLGNDNEITGDQIARTDTMIVLSINRTTGTVSMLTLPRDLFVYIPGWTMQRLNNAYVRGEAVGWTDGGFGLMRQTLMYNFGINVHYYAMVDLTGFKALVDAVGGIELAVDCAIQDLPLMESAVPEGAIRINEDGEYVLPVGYYHMDGAEALWYARSRGNSSDFDRGPRQMQVLRAVWRTARNQGLLAQVPELWNQGIQYVETNLTLPDILGLVPLAVNLDPSNIDSYSLIRTYHTTPWTTPNGENVQVLNYEPLRQLLQNFYTPPTSNQVAVEAPTVAVYNGTTNANWDRVAAESLAWEGFNAVAMGAAPTSDYASTVLTDHAGSRKGSSLEQLARMLNVQFENMVLDPRSDRQYDFEVIVGADYNSCSRSGVLPVDTAGN